MEMQEPSEAIENEMANAFNDALNDVLVLRRSSEVKRFDMVSLKKWIENSWRIQSVLGVGADKVTSASVADKFLSVAKHGAKHVAAATLGVGIDQFDGISPRSKSIVEAVSRGFVTALSPFSGEVCQVSHSLGRGWLLIEEARGYCLASNMGNVMIDVNLETVWVFPTEHLILSTTLGRDVNGIADETAKLFHYVLSLQDKVIAYLNRNIPESGDGISVSDFWCPHMSHNLWNIQTSWFNILERVPGSNFKNIFNYARQNFFGSLSELYPEKMAGSSPVEYVTVDQELFERAMTSGGVLLEVKDEIFRPGFAESLLRRARSVVSPEFLNELAELRATCRPLVVTTIRLDNREWVEQREGYPKLFSALKSDFPRMGVVLDGLSRDTSKGWTTGWMSMEQELSVANIFREHTTKEMPVVFAVGRTFSEALLLCDACDCFIAPSGSGMALYKWISNMPGLAFSNKAVLDERSNMKWPLRVWHNPAFRSDITPTVHISPDLVEDADIVRDHESRANFHLDWEALYRESKAYLKSLGF